MTLAALLAILVPGAILLTFNLSDVRAPLIGRTANASPAR